MTCNGAWWSDSTGWAREGKAGGTARMERERSAATPWWEPAVPVVFRCINPS